MAKATVLRGTAWGFLSATTLAAVLLIIVSSSLYVAPVASQPLRPWKPPTHIRDPHNGGLSVNMDNDDLASRQNRPELVAPEPIPGIIVWTLKRTGGDDFVTTLLKEVYAWGLSFSPLCSEDADSFASTPPTRERIYT